MSRRRFQGIVWTFTVACTVYFLDMVSLRHDAVSLEAFKAGVPLFATLMAGTLAYSVQRRISYLAASRDFWSEINSAVHDALSCARTTRYDPAEHARAITKLQTAMDSIRSLFTNTKSLSSFERLREIERALRDRLGPDTGDAGRDDLQRVITDKWRPVREELLADFDRVKGPIKAPL